MASIDDYEPASKLNAALTKALISLWEKLGCPNDCSSPAGWIMVDQIVNVWTKFFQAEAEAWMLDRQDDLANEISMSDLKKKGGGYNPITFPPTLYLLLKAMLPDQKLNDKKFQRKLSLRHPLFKTTNFKL